MLNLSPNRIAPKWLCLTDSWHPNSHAQKAAPKRLGQIVPFRPEISLFWGILIAITSSGTQEVLPTPGGEEVFDWVISSDLLPLNDPDIPTLLHRSSPSIFFASFSLALSCFWEVLQDLGSDHLPTLLSVSLSPVFRPNERPPSFNFQKARWNDFAFYLALTVLLQRNTRLFPLLLSLPLWHKLRPNLPFVSAASNAILKLGGMLRWKERLVKDARLLRPLNKSNEDR